MEKLLGIQYLRGIAAILVLIFHVSEVNHASFFVGSAGVDIFLVISGFVMWITTYNKSLSFWQFASRRIQRLVPLYWFVTLTTVILAIAKPQYFHGTAVGLTEVFKSLAFVPYYSNNHNWPIVGQGWTLNIEMFFYFVFAISLRSRFLFRLCFPTLLLACLTLAGYFVRSSNAILASWSSNLLMELAGGLWVGFAYTNGWLKHRYLGWVLVGFAASAFTLFQTSNYPLDTYRLAVFGLPALAIVSGFLMIESTQGIPRIPVLLFLGEASYSIYLWQGLALLVVSAMYFRLGVDDSAMAAVLMGLAALGASLLGFLFVEKPLTMILKRY